MDQILKRKFKIANPKVMTKQQEFVRLARVRCRSRWTAGSECLVVGCLELACKHFSHPFDRSTAHKICGQKLVYNNSLNSLRNLLGIKDGLSVKELCVKFGCTILGPLVKSNFDSFKKKFLEMLPLEKRHQANFSKNVYLAVAFYLTAKSKKSKVDRAKLRKLAHNCSEAEFCAVQAQFEDLLPQLVVPSAKKKTDRKRKEGSGDLDSLEREQVVVTSMSENPSLRNTALTQNATWKRKAIRCIEKENRKNAPKRSKMRSLHTISNVEIQPSPASKSARFSLDRAPKGPAAGVKSLSKEHRRGGPN